MKKHAAETAIEFEPEYVTGLKKIFEEMIVFNQLLGLKVTSIEADRARGRIEMRRELIGHYSHNRIHGGVISASLDAMGGLAVLAAIGARHMDETPDHRLARFGGKEQGSSHEALLVHRDVPSASITFRRLADNVSPRSRSIEIVRSRSRSCATAR